MLIIFTVAKIFDRFLVEFSVLTYQIVSISISVTAAEACGILRIFIHHKIVENHQKERKMWYNVCYDTI